MTIDLEPFLAKCMKTSKLWGYELLLENTPEYCAKVLGIKSGFKCSLHRHHVKSESFFPLVGNAVIKIVKNPAAPRFNEIIPLSPYSEYRSVRINPGTFHQFWSADGEPAVLLEVSSHHEDSDVERLEESGTLEPF